VTACCSSSSSGPLVDADELARFAAVPAPTGAEEARVAWLEQRLAAAPGRRYRDSAGNLIWTFTGWRPELRPALLVMAHLDTVFGADTELHFERDGEVLVGPGIGDNASGVMAVVWALQEVAPVAGLVVAFTVGEEGLGNLRGARYVCEQLRPDRVIAVEGHGLDSVVINHVGSVRARIEVRGPGGHSWRDRGTPSAVHELVRLAGQLIGERINIGRLVGGTAVNAVASSAELIVELRSLDNDELNRFEGQLNALSVPEPLVVAHEVVGRRGAGRIDPDDPLVMGVLSARRALGLPDALGDASTDANAAAALGIPAVGIGCARGDGMHTLHERINLGALEVGVQQLRSLLLGAKTWG
jgi:tripeptide aminopeptidase